MHENLAVRKYLRLEYSESQYFSLLNYVCLSRLVNNHRNYELDLFNFIL